MLGRSGARPDTMQGFLPIKGNLKGNDTILKMPEVVADTVDAVRLDIFKNTIKRMRDQGVTVILFDSPVYELENPHRNMASEQAIKDVCAQYGVPVFDNRYLDEFRNSPEYFFDPTHINKEGTAVYTPIVIGQVRSVLEK